ncbi:hypothetical protein N410_05880 [Helicobacter pylori GC26]|nr:hypothetical protein N206_05335 [Helicobacter pylori UM111]EQL76217.1 hypothetical protein N410_05880 [Helicobacter pylori GC26]
MKPSLVFIALWSAFYWCMVVSHKWFYLAL